MPYANIANPDQTRLLSTADKPTFKEFEINSEGSSLVHPYVEADDPRCAKDLMGSEESKCKESSADGDTPK
jgi:hypothetical protein